MNFWVGRPRIVVTVMPKRLLGLAGTECALGVMELARIFGETHAAAAMALRSATRAKEAVGCTSKIS